MKKGKKVKQVSDLPKTQLVSQVVINVKTNENNILDQFFDNSYTPLNKPYYISKADVRIKPKERNFTKFHYTYDLLLIEIDSLVQYKFSYRSILKQRSRCLCQTLLLFYQCHHGYQGSQVLLL